MLRAPAAPPAAYMTMVASYRFGPFTVDAGSYRLLRGSEVIPLSPKIIDLLLYLVARQSALVPKDELFAALWPDVAVTDNALTQAVSELRQALGDDSSKPTYIQTVARRGYRFIAPVEAAAPSPPSAAPAVEPALDTKPPAIAVLDFTNVSTDREFAWLSSGIAETVTNDLRAAGTLRIIDRVRVVEAVHSTGVDLAALRKELHLDLAVVGSFQRSGDRLRITARVVDAGTGEALAEAKADGALEQVFELQDRIVAQFAETLGTARVDAAVRRTHRETSSLEAYQAFTEGRVRLESLDGSLVPGAIADFERAVVLDPRYALAHVGIGNARFWQYEMSRARNQPDAALLARAIDHVRRAIELERDLAEAHATFAFLLVSAGRFSEALVAARRAVALEPGYWGNQFRLAHAEWGEDRLRALARAMELYADFPFAHFEAAMVHIARGSLDRAESVLREGTIVQDRQANLRQRYPAKGLHWLLGLVRLAQRDAREARAEFDREVAVGPAQLYAAEFAMNAYDGAGFVALETRDAAGAVAMFSRALELFPEHARSLVGLGAALAASGDTRKADAAFKHAANAIDALRRGGRGSEATLAEAFMHAVCGRHDEAIGSLKRLVDRPELPFTGWTIPIEPLFAPLRQRADFQGILATLAQHAR
jgi:DNA-binding winged helix-turn-helix (wHTH) protein/tetratricopeptide (TPR) repeat protein